MGYEIHCHARYGYTYLKLFTCYWITTNTTVVEITMNFLFFCICFTLITSETAHSWVQ